MLVKVNEAAQSDLATKSDIMGLKVDIQSVRGEITKGRVELLQWLIGVTGIQTVVIISTIIAIVRGGLH